MLKIKELIIYLSSKCNKRCKHCIATDEERRTHPITLSEEDLDWIKNNIDAKKVIFLGGEPLIAPNLEYALELFKDTMLTISTNGTFVKKKINLLKKYKLEGLQFSVEGGKEETDDIRGEGTWDTVIEGVEVAKKYKLNPYLRASFWTGNYDKLYEVIDLGEKLGVPVTLFPRVDKPPLPPSLTRDLFDMCLMREDCIVAVPNFFQYIGKKGRCGAGEERISIFYDRRITPCNMDLNYTLGRIGDDVEDIKRNMKIFVENFKTIPVECAGCPHANVCKGSCYMAKAHLGCPLRYNVSMENMIYNYKLDKDKMYEKAEVLTDFMRRVLVC